MQKDERDVKAKLHDKLDGIQDFKDLPDKEQIFILEYCTHFNRRKAGEAAGWSKSYIDHVAGHLLRLPSIKEMVDEIQRQRLEDLEITPYNILAEIKKIAFFNPKDIFDNNWNLKNMDEIPDDALAAVAGIENGRLGGRKVKLHDKTGNLTLLGKYCQMFESVARDEVSKNQLADLTEALNAGPATELSLEEE